jgi:hypothetical protein
MNKHGFRSMLSCAELVHVMLMYNHYWCRVLKEMMSL